MAEAVTKIPVTMTDGSVVYFGTKQKLVKTSTIGDDGSIVLRLDFSNGQTRGFTMPESLRNRFAAHGMEQKLGDAIAGESDVEDAVVSMDDLIARLSNGEWTAARASGGFTGSSVLIRALVEASGKTPEAIKEWLSTKTQAEKLALRRTEKLAPIVARLEAEKGAKAKTTIDTDTLLGELGDLGVGAPAKRTKATVE